MVVALGVGTAVVHTSLNDQAFIADRLSFYDFPTRLNGKTFQAEALTEGELDILKPDDYFLGRYQHDDGSNVGLYMVYYEEQSEGSALHSPRVCIPGGGWEIVDETVRAVSLGVDGSQLAVNRVVIQKGELTQVVYYWIDQMGRTYTNEYLARISLLKSATLNNRSDGALLRVNTIVHDATLQPPTRN